MANKKKSKKLTGLNIKFRTVQSGSPRGRVYSLPMKLGVDSDIFATSSGNVSHNFDEAPELIRDLLEELAAIDAKSIKAVWVLKSSPREVFVYVRDYKHWDEVHNKIMQVLRDYVLRRVQQRSDENKSSNR